MNNLVNDPLLRYASLAGAGLPACDRHLARARSRQRVSGGVASEAGDRLRDEVTFTVSLIAHEADPDALRIPELSLDEATSIGGRPKRMLVLLAY